MARLNTHKIGTMKMTISYTLDKHHKIIEVGLTVKRERMRTDITFKKETAKNVPELMKDNKTRNLKHNALKEAKVSIK